MFNQFRKNLNFYLSTQEPGSYRHHLGVLLKDMLLDPNAVLSPTFNMIQDFQATEPKIERFIFELWAYGYRFCNLQSSNKPDATDYWSNPPDSSLAKDLVALINMLYGTNYWAD